MLGLLYSGAQNGRRQATDTKSTFQLVTNYQIRHPLPMHDHAKYRIIFTINILLIIFYYAYGTQHLFMQVAGICKEEIF